MDDLQLVERMKHGDEAAFAELFGRHKAAVHRYAAHMAGPDAADDVLQEVFLALLRQVSQYDPSRGSLQGYLLGIARRQVFKRLGAAMYQALEDEPDARAVELPAGNPFEDLNRAEIVASVRAAIAMLPPVFREAVVLCELNELDYAAAAGIMNCPIGTVRSRLHRARALLVVELAAMRPGALNSHV